MLAARKPRAHQIAVAERWLQWEFAQILGSIQSECPNIKSNQNIVLLGAWLGPQGKKPRSSARDHVDISYLFEFLATVFIILSYSNKLSASVCLGIQFNKFNSVDVRFSAVGENARQEYALHF